MRWVAITGNIGVGKSSVCQIFINNNFPVIEADKIAHKILFDQKVINQIVNTFGQSVLVNNLIDRKKLAEKVFNSKTDLVQLEQIVHPLISKLVESKKKELAKIGHKLAFYDVPLLFEKNMQNQFDSVIVVASNKDLTLKRLLKRGLSKQKISNRIKHQLTQKEKLEKASFIIWNNGSKDELEKHCNTILKKITSSLNENIKPKYQDS